MKLKPTLSFLGLIALLAVLTGLISGCSSGGGYSSGYGSSTYGYGHSRYDPYFYDPWYRHGPIIVNPPPSRPVRPVHPIEPARPVPRPLPAAAWAR